MAVKGLLPRNNLSDVRDRKSARGNIDIHSTLVPLVIFIGESNTGGTALNSAATAGELAARPAVQILNNSTLLFEDLNVGTNNLLGHDELTGVTDPRGGGTYDQTSHGWEVGLANSVEADEWMTDTVYLVKAGQGGSLLSEWNDGGSYMNAFDARLAAALSELKAAGKIPLIYVWSSIGINNSIAGTNVNTFKAQLNDWLRRIRVRVGFAPICLTELPAAYTTYNAAIEEVCEEEMTFFVETTDAGLAGDGNHWTYSGMKVIAGRMVDVAVDDIGENEKYLLSQQAATGRLALAVPRVATPELSVDNNEGESLVTITTDTSGASTYYTTDGSAPTSASSLYSTPVSMTVSGTIKAIAIKDGYRDSLVASESITVTPGLTTIVWTNLQNASNSSGYIVASGSSPAGGIGPSIDATQPFTIEWTWDSQVLTETVVGLIDNDNTAVYNWIGTTTYRSGIYHYASDIYKSTDPNTTTDTSVNVGSFPMLVRATKSGNDLVYTYSTDGGENWIALTTHSGALTGQTTIYVKVIFAVPSSGLKIKGRYITG
jgi:hypothetical protein